MMDYQDFVQKLKNTDLHFKNKFYTLLYFKEASGNLIIDKQNFTIQNNSFVFINYNQIYCLQQDLCSKAEIIMFTKSFYNYVYTGNKLIKNDTALNNLSSFITPKQEQSEEIVRIVDEIRNEYHNLTLLKKEVLCLLLKVLMLKYTRNTGRKNKSNRAITSNDELVISFNDLLEKYYKEWHTTSKYAEKLSLTSNYLNTVIKKKLDISTTQVIKNRIILEAQRLLLHTTISVVQISYELGFSDNSHFGKYFKSATGLSPNEFRKKNSGSLS